MRHCLIACVPMFVLSLAATSSAQATPCGFEWMPVATATGDASLAAVAAVQPDDVWAVGNTASATGRSTLALHFDGVRWRAVPTPNGTLPINYLLGVAALAANDVWAVGYSTDQTVSTTLVLHWNGSTWSIVPSPNPTLPGSPYPPANRLRGIAAAAANDIWAVGQTYDFTDSAALALHFDGTAWTTVKVPSPGNQVVLNAVCARGGNDVWAVGDHSLVGLQTGLMLHWNGASWTAVPNPNVGPFLNSMVAVAAGAANDVFAVGYRLAIFTVNQRWQTAVLHWDGVAWSAQPSPNVNQQNNQLRGVAVCGPGDAWAVGHYDTGTALRTLALHWDGVQWSIGSSANAGSAVDHLLAVTAINAHDLFAVGESFDVLQYDALVERLGGEGQANGTAATLTIDGIGADNCPGPHHVVLTPNSTVALGFTGPANAPLLLALGGGNRGVGLGCAGTLGIGTPPLFNDLALLSGLQLDVAGAHSLSLPLGNVPIGIVFGLQAAMLQGNGCGIALTAAFDVSVR